MKLGRLLVLLALALLVALPPVAEAQSTIVIVPGAGLADPTPAAPIGGNPGTTVGQQRSIVFQRAADIWGALLNSAVPIRVQAAFVPQFCSATSATLGSAGPITFVGNFPGAVQINTWYHVALGNALAGFDLSPLDDITANFNSNLNGNPACLGGTSWYYGLDNAAPAGTIDFLTVILHEMGHGLGFSSLVSLVTGTVPGPMPNDIWNYFLFDATLGVPWTGLTPAGKLFSSTNTGNLTWSGPNVTGALGGVTAGINAATGFIQMYAPNPAQPGSSVSHFDTAVTPNELMEPFFTTPTKSVGLARQLLQDMAWGTNPPGYTLYTPVPGPAGNNTLFTVAGATPGAGQTTFLVYGTVAGPFAVPGCGGASIGIANPVILTSGPAAANGEFNFTLFVGGGAAGVTVLLQAVELPSCQITNLVTHTF